MKQIIPLKHGEYVNNRLKTTNPDIINDERVPCIWCDLNCEFSGKPRIGAFVPIGPGLGWSVRVDICNDITLDFDTLKIDGELIIFKQERRI